jgi:hypothetical protein
MQKNGFAWATAIADMDYIQTGPSFPNGVDNRKHAQQAVRTLDQHCLYQKSTCVEISVSRTLRVCAEHGVHYLIVIAVCDTSSIYML